METLSRPGWCHQCDIFLVGLWHQGACMACFGCYICHWFARRSRVYIMLREGCKHLCVIYFGCRSEVHTLQHACLRQPQTVGRSFCTRPEMHAKNQNHHFAKRKNTVFLYGYGVRGHDCAEMAGPCLARRMRNWIFTDSE